MLKDKTGDVAARPRQAGDVATGKRIEIDGDHDNRDEAAHAHDRLQRRLRPAGNDQIRPGTRQLRGSYEGATRIVHVLIIDRKILTFAKATLSQCGAERLIRDCCRRAEPGW